MKECYIDMHCHILPGVDDGAKDLAETKKMLEIAYAEGIRCIIATPHHHPHRGKAPAEKLRERAKLVREAAHEIDERFRVYLGTEVYFGQDVADKLKEGKILSMNRREYVLVEFRPHRHTATSDRGFSSCSSQDTKSYWRMSNAITVSPKM